MPQYFPTEYADALSQLPPLSWRGIKVPIASITTDGGHDVAEHKKPDVRGARLENTGELPRSVQARVMLRNGIQLDTSPQSAMPLFPGVADAFVAALRDGTTGDLVHPRFGTMRCKVLTWREVVEAGVRDGANYDVTWKETNDDDSALGLNSSALASAAVTATLLDADLISLRLANSAAQAQINGVLPATSFSDLVRSIQAASDNVAFIQRRGAGSIDNVVNQVSAVASALDSMGNVATNAARQHAEQLTAALNLLKGTAQVNRRVGTYVVPDGKSQTMGSIAGQFAMSPNDLYRLNPALSGITVLRAGTTVRYYLPS